MYLYRRQIRIAIQDSYARGFDAIASWAKGPVREFSQSVMRFPSCDEMLCKRSYGDFSKRLVEPLWHALSRIPLVRVLIFLGALSNMPG